MLTAIAMSTFLVLATIILHFFVLRLLASRIHHEQNPLRRPLLVVLLVLFATHLAEIAIFAAGFRALDWLGAGYLTTTASNAHLGFAETFYFSISCYTTLGIGDIVPHGAIRLVAGLEALNGLLLIAWSASFTYLMMERLWSPRREGE